MRSIVTTLTYRRFSLGVLLAGLMMAVPMRDASSFTLRLQDGFTVRQQPAAPASSVAGSSTVIPHIEEPIRVDGRMDDAAWRGIDPLPMTMYQPVFRGDKSERTDIRVAHDHEYLYVSARMYDSEPDGVLASSLSRDGGGAADDYLNVVVDPFNDNENALWFYTNPAGIRGDMAVSNDAIDFRAMNESWDGFWDVAVRQSDEGWFAEMRIPFSTLGFKGSGEQVQMGLAISRVISRKNERHVYPAIPPNWDLGFAKPSQAQLVTMRGVKSNRPVYITPFIRGGVDRNPSLNATGTRYDTALDVDRDVGLDVRYNLTSNLIADVTVNTDFAQAEADNQQINLSRFSLFFPEKRQFFQERAGIFEYSLGFQDRLFHSRRIGLVDGEPMRVFGGGRVVGRVADWDVGALSLQTEAPGAASSENFSVLRTRRRVLNPYSYVGGMLTSRIQENGNTNVALALDGIFRVTGDEYLTVRVAQTADDQLTPTIGEGFSKNGFAQIQWQRRRQEGFNYMAWLTRWEEDFVPRMGFHRLTDFTQTLGRLAYNWLPGQGSRWRRLETAAFANLKFANSDGSLESGVWGSSNEFESKAGQQIDFELLGNFERLAEPLAFPDNASVPSGRHRYYEALLVAQSSQGRRLRLGLTMGYGSFFDGTKSSLAVAPVWSVSRYLEFTPVYLFDRVRFDDRGEGFDSHILRFRTNLALNSKLSASSFVQLNSANDALAVNARLRYNFRERNDLWIVYNEGLNLDRRTLTPEQPVSSGRLVLLKYTYTFAL